MEDKDQLMEELENARQAGDDDKVIELESILRGMGIKGYEVGGDVSQGGGIAVTGTKYRGTF